MQKAINVLNMLGEDMIIKNANKEDLNEVSTIMAKVFKKSPWNENWSKEECLNRLTNIFDFPTSRNFVYIEEEKIIGYSTGFILPFENKKVFTLMELFIKEEYQHQHKGSEVLSKLENKLKEENISTIDLYTKGSLVNFYSNNGYKENKDEHRMEKEI